MTARPQRIGINLCEIDWSAPEPGDLATLETLRAWIDAPASDIAPVLLSLGHPAALTDLFQHFEHHSLPVPSRAKAIRSGAEATWMRAAVRQHHLDVLHDARPGVSGVVSIPKVVTVNDLRDVRPSGRRFLQRGSTSASDLPRGLAGAQVVVAPSVAVADRLVAEHGVPDHHIHLVPWPRRDTEAVMPIDTVRARFGVIGAVVLVDADRATPEHLIWVLRAMKYLESRISETSLVFVGDGVVDDPAFRRAVREMDMDAWVTRLRDPKPAVRASLQRHAEVLVCAGEAEGFAASAVSAMAAGVPVVAASTSAAADVVDGVGASVHPGDETQLALELHRLLTDPTRRAAAVEAARMTASDFTSARALAELHAAYRSVLVPL